VKPPPAAAPETEQLVLDFDVATADAVRRKRRPPAPRTDTVELDLIPAPVKVPRKKPGPKWPSFTATYEDLNAPATADSSAPAPLRGRTATRRRQGADLAPGALDSVQGPDCAPCAE